MQIKKLINFIFILSTFGLHSCGAYAGTFTHPIFPSISESVSDYILVQDYAIGYDSYTKTPAWVEYTVDKYTTVHTVPRKGRFASDRRLKRKDRAYTSWYRKSGYDRGHMAPAINFRYSKKAEKKTFIMTNVIPQRPAVNRGIWKSIENRVQKHGKSVGGVVVIAGPIFEGTVKLLHGKVHIPAACYKIIVSKDRSKVIAFIIPNVKAPKGYKLKDYAVGVDEIEKRTGIDFFSTRSIAWQAKHESIVAVRSDWPILLK